MDFDDPTKLFHAIVWPQRATVLRTATFLTRDEADAEDLAQETLLKAFKAIGSFREGTDVRAWLLAILRNTRIDRLRSAAAHSAPLSLDQLELDPADDSTGGTDDDPAWRDPGQLLESLSDRVIIEALQQLPEDIRWTLLLVDVQCLSLADAATVMGVPVGTVKSRASRGRACLRQALLPLARNLRLVP